MVVFPVRTRHPVRRTRHESIPPSLRENGNIDGIVRLSGGTAYDVIILFEPEDPVIIDAEHATVERLFADAPAGQPFPFTLVAAPGWAITNIVATAADGTELSLYDMGSHYVFDMPASAVTVRLELASDWVAFPSPDSGGPGGSSLQDDRLGNGFLVLRSTPRIPCRDDEWRASSLRIVDRLPDGHVVAEAALDPGASPLPARFFRPAITTFAR